MKCSRCGSRYPNPGCYVCRDTEQPAPETPDHDSGHLLKTLTMKPETARTACSFVIVALAAVIVLLAATGCRDFEAYTAIILLGVLAGFIGATQDA